MAIGTCSRIATRRSTDLVSYADIARDLDVYGFAAMLYWNIVSAVKPEDYGGRELLEDFLYCLEQLGVKDLKENFRGDHAAAFARIKADRKKRVEAGPGTDEKAQPQGRPGAGPLSGRQETQSVIRLLEVIYRDLRASSNRLAWGDSPGPCSGRLAREARRVLSFLIGSLGLALRVASAGSQDLALADRFEVSFSCWEGSLGKPLPEEPREALAIREEPAFHALDHQVGLIITGPFRPVPMSSISRLRCRQGGSRTDSLTVHEEQGKDLRFMHRTAVRR